MRILLIILVIVAIVVVASMLMRPVLPRASVGARDERIPQPVT